MLWLRDHHALETFNHCLRVWLRLPTWTPIVPRHRIHQRLRVNRGHRHVVGVDINHFSQRVCPRMIKWVARGLTLSVVTVIQRQNPASLFLCDPID